MQVVAAEVFRDEIVKLVLAILGGEFLDDRIAARIGDVSGDLAPQRPMTDRLQPLTQEIEDPVGCGVRELLTEALEIAECIFVDETDEAEELQKRILQRRRGEKQFLFLGERLLEGVRDDIRRLVDIAKAVGLIDDDEIPGVARTSAALLRANW